MQYHTVLVEKNAQYHFIITYTDVQQAIMPV
jgi:hypothetical protein